MEDRSEDKKVEQEQQPPQEDWKTTAGEIGGGLLKGIRDGGKRFAEQQREQRKDWERRRVLTGKEWLLCIIFPPLGFFLLWKNRSDIKTEQAFGAVTGGLITISAVGFIALFILASIGNAIGDYRRTQEREEKRLLAERQHNEVLPAFEEKLQRGIDAFQAGEYRLADQAFFDAARYVDEVEETAREAYFGHRWSERRSEATLGRAASVLEQGQRNASAALIEEAIDQYSDPSFPVASAEGEQLLRASIERRNQRAREQDPDWLQNDFNRRLNDATVDRIRRGY